MPIKSAGIAFLGGILLFSSCVDPNRKAPLESINRVAAKADRYQTFGNVDLNIDPQAGVLANDESQLPITSYDKVSKNGGTVNMNPDGSFTYVPPAGFQGTDEFLYRVTIDPKNEYVGTVSIDITEMVWFIDNSASVNGTGTINSPFNTLKSVESVSAPGDTIYIAEGTGDSTGQDQGIQLKDRQKLIGAGVDLVIGTTTLIPVDPLGNPPVISNTAGNAVLLEDGNEVAGLTIDGTTLGGIAGNVINGFKMTETTITNTTLSGVIIFEPTGTIDITQSTVIASAKHGFEIFANTTSSVVQITDNVFSSNQWADVQIYTYGTARIDPYVARNTSSGNQGAAAYVFAISDASTQIGTVSTNTSSLAAGDGIRILISGGSAVSTMNVNFNRMDISTGHGLFVAAAGNTAMTLNAGSNTFSNSRINGASIATDNSAVMNLNFTSNIIFGSNGVGLSTITSGASIMTQRILSNDIRTSTFRGAVVAAAGTSVINALVAGNTLASNNIARTNEGSFQFISGESTSSGVCVELVSNNAGKAFEAYRGTGTSFFLYNNGMNTPSVSLSGGLNGNPTSTTSGSCVP